jgi:small-conductance mechanosensitive channel
MLEQPQQVVRNLSDALAWAPAWLVALAVLGVAALAALAVHWLATRALLGLLRRHAPYLRSVLLQTTGLTRFALLLIALIVALPAVPLSPQASDVVTRLLLLGVVALVGWTILTAGNITADIYLRQFRAESVDPMLARKHITQIRVLIRAFDTLVVVMTIAAGLMTFEPVRQYGVSLFASAGVAGLIAGLAARPVLANLFAGVQLAITQPIRIGDSVIVENEFGTIDEITSAYVVVRLWDLRRLIVPLGYFIEKPFQNWTREETGILGTVMVHVDYAASIARIRDKAKEIVEASALWDRQAFGVQVTDLKPDTVEVRILVSAANAGAIFDLRCEIREKLIDFLRVDYPQAIPRHRQEAVAIVAGPAARPDERPAAGDRPG